MSNFETANYEEVLNIVRQWSTEQQVLLVQDVLKSLSPKAKPKRATLKTALSILPPGQPSPSDAQVEQWLEERRMGRSTNAATI